MTAVGENSRPARSDWSALPTCTVTFVLTDVVGSSGLWEASSQAMVTASVRLYEIIDDCVRRRGGVRPLEQGEGDSTVSAFARAIDGVHAALDMQLAVQAESWPVQAPLRIRIGVHTGDAELRDDRNYVGAALSRCARIRDIGRGDDVLLSGVTAALVEDRLPEGAELVDRGVHQLRGLGRSERVHQLLHPSLPADKEPFATEPVSGSNLPIQLTSFIGRETEVAEIETLVRDRRLVTLVGSGGSGKTRLSLEVASRLEASYADGVHWVDLAPIADPALVPHAVASALRVRDVPSQQVSVTIVNELRDRQLLVVLDNCEHVAAASAALADRLLRSCPNLRLVATSREPLGAAGETTWHAPSMSLPSDGEADDLDQLLMADAIRLFVERAADVRPHFQLNAQNGPTVVAICRRLDGLPLAIELAASRVRSMTPQQIAGGLADRFRLLTGGARTALARQRTLEASVAWSHDLLSEAERVVFRRLAVFAGGFTLQAAEQIVSGDGVDEIAVLDLLSQLVERCLLQVDDSGGVARYRMLETVRDYARHKLTDAAEAPTLRDRHLEHFAELAGSLPDDFNATELESWLVVVEADYDNLRVAMDWSIESSQVDVALRLPAALMALWSTRTGLNEARTRAEAALALDGGDQVARAMALALSAASGTRYEHDAPVMLERLREARRLGHEAGDERCVRRVTSMLGWALFLLEGKVPEARQLLDDVALSADAAHDHYFLAHSLTSRGVVELPVGRQATAKSFLRRGVEVARSNGDRFNLQRGLVWAAFAELQWTSLGEARVLLDEAVVLGRDRGDQSYFAMALALRALVAMQVGEHLAAHVDLDESLQVARRADLASATAIAETALAELLYREGTLAEARAHAEHACELYGSLRQRTVQWFSFDVRARVELASGNRQDAARYAQEALALFESGGIGFAIHPARATLTEVALLDDDLEEAERVAQEYLEVATAAELPLDTVLALESVARVSVRIEHYVAAARLVAAADAARVGLGCVRPPIAISAHEADVTALREALGGAFDTAWSEGAALTLDDAVAYARRARGERRRPTHGWASLTPAEQQVVALVCEGLTNPQIGERLFIASGTVRIHLSHVFRKLGVTTRAELAALATRRSLK